MTTGQDLSDPRSPEELIAEAVAKAKEADVGIYIGGLNKAHHNDCEGYDREQYGLPYGQDALIEALVAANLTVSLALNERAFQYYDVPTHNWKSEPGKFNLLIGTSSRDIVKTRGYEL